MDAQSRGFAKKNPNADTQSMSACVKEETGIYVWERDGKDSTLSLQVCLRFTPFTCETVS